MTVYIITFDNLDVTAKSFMNILVILKMSFKPYNQYLNKALPGVLLNEHK